MLLLIELNIEAFQWCWRKIPAVAELTDIHLLETMTIHSKLYGTPTSCS